MKRKLILTILAVSVVALLIGGVASAFYADNSENVCVTAQAARVGVELEGPCINLGCIVPGFSCEAERSWKVTCCCPSGMPLYAKPLVNFVTLDETLASHVTATVKFDQGGMIDWVTDVPLNELQGALEAHSALLVPAFLCNIPMKIWVAFDYPETMTDQSEDMGDKIVGNLYIRMQTIPF